MDKCKICGEWAFYSSHTCAPMFIAYEEGYDEVEVYARDPEGAAIKYMEKKDTCDLSDEHSVIVVDPRADTEYTFTVYVETVPSFSVTQTDERPHSTEEETQEEAEDEE